MKNQFGYVKSKAETSGGPKQQPPISRPVPSPLPAQQHAVVPEQMGQLNSMVRGLLEQRSYSSLDQSSLLAKRFQGAHLPPSSHQMPPSSHLSSILSSSSIAELTGGSLHQPNNQSINPYEKWSNGQDNLFGLPTHPSQEAFKVSSARCMGSTFGSFLVYVPK